MRINEIIKILQELKEKYGNLECYTNVEGESWGLEEFMEEYEFACPRLFSETNEKTQETKYFILI